MAEFIVLFGHGTGGDTILSHNISTFADFVKPLVVWTVAVVLSIGVLAVRWCHQQESTEETKPDLEDPRSSYGRVPIAYDLIQQCFRAALLTIVIIGVFKDGSSTILEVCGIIYTITLDTWRIFLGRNVPFRATLLHHVNALTVTEAILCTSQLVASTLFVNAEPLHSPLVLLKFWASILCVFMAFITPRQWRPPMLSFGLAQRDDMRPSPEQTCSYFSYYITYGWMTNLILTGFRRRLGLHDLLPLPEYDEPLIWRERIMAARRRFKTTAWTLAYTLRRNIAAMVFFAAMTAAVEFIAPFALYRLLNHIQNPELATIKPFVWVFMLFLGPVLRSIAYQQYIFSSTRLVVRTKLCLIQELYAKAGRCFDSEPARKSDSVEGSEAKPASGQEKDSGTEKSENVTNLMAYDVDAIWSSRDFILVSTASPIEITIGLVFLYSLFGPCALVALAVMLLSSPLAAILSSVMSFFQRKVMKRTDARISAITEYLSSMRIIKYLGWEETMAQKIQAERATEEKLLWRRNLSSIIVTILGDLIPLFALFSLFATYTVVLGHTLTAAKAFTSLSIIETLRLQFVWIANVTRFYSQGRIAFSRIDRYMCGEPEITRLAEGAPRFCNATFRRALPEDSFRLHADLEFVIGGLNVLTGVSGSGKSSMLMSLMGETILENGTATCPRDVSYAPQVPWLLDDTIRGNILLHEDFDHERFNAVVYACGLGPDLERFADQDLAECGVNGSNLSGGQKQRICLARALYSKSSVLLLDDVFSALDASTQKHVWEYAFSQDILQGRTVILVTQMQAAKDGADFLVEVSHGSVESSKLQGSNRRATASQGWKAPAIIRSTELAGSASSSMAEPVHCTEENNIEDKIHNETAGKERNPRTLFYQYMLLFGGHGPALFGIFLCLLPQLAFFALPLWLSVWVAASQDEDIPNYRYLRAYGGLLLLFSTLQGISLLYLQYGAWKVAHYMHKKLVTAALWVSVQWYDSNPPGRFVNRFSSDMYSLDSVLVDYLRISIDNAFRFLLRLTAIGSVMPIFGIPAALVCAIGFICAEMYTRTQLSVRNLASASHSPIFSFFIESISGRTVIRSRSGMQSSFADKLARRLRVWAKVGETQFNLNRWISVRADGCGAIIALATGIIALSMGSQVSAGRLGFSLTSAIGLGQTILNMVRNMNELEVELNCFHRANEYATLPLEGAPAGESKALQPPALHEGWPTEGNVQLRNITVKYNKDGPEILKDVSLNVLPGERVAIVGRTGSGKSTLALSLLGFTNIAKGSILIDGIDIATVPLQTLRQRLTIIPQDPILFAGDVRFNLDPAKDYTENELRQALEGCSIVESLSNPSTQRSPESVVTHIRKHIDLDTPVAPRGSNFSVGQRQAISLARATVRRSRVLILDEATASIDHKSDAVIQNVLRSTLSGKTIIAIVHRLSTILDYDKIVVLDAGRVREVGTPRDLYASKGVFHEMVTKSIEQGKGGEWTQEKLGFLGL